MITPEQEIKIKEMRANKQSYFDIAMDLCISPIKVQEFCQKNNLNKRIVNPHKHSYRVFKSGAKTGRET